ncbi:SCP-like protein [Teladorsagia circumcincta]|uniref:SCP-like protein n=1 Tax=Teladorsagia circumcincta TaxID=45464 RepID=A0A2G9UV76_TELCI|nr:SCP-like protein [Teladorsagia circumcincta]
MPQFQDDEASRVDHAVYSHILSDRGLLKDSYRMERQMYSTDLENGAQNYANSCPSSACSNSTIGENIALVPNNTASGYYDAVFQAIKAFWQEIKVNANGINEAMVFTDALKYSTLAPLRFTQMAWANTHQVGCGARLCGGNYVVVCRYSPRISVFAGTVDYGL